MKGDVYRKSVSQLLALLIGLRGTPCCKVKRGHVGQPSNVGPNRIFTADSHIVLYRLGGLRVDKLNEIIERVIDIVRS